ncbi:MAG: TonB-dependent receptor plug domain-containing protein [Bacteroidales bacterium]
MRKLIIITLGLFMAVPMIAQNRVVHGRLTVFKRYPVKNVEVKAKKAKTSITTDSLGMFDIVCYDKDVIQIKPKTFEPVTRRVNADTDTLEINLVFIDSKANRENAVGYGYIREKDLLYAVDHLEAENNDFCGYSTIFDLIQGKLSGVQVSNGNIYIRGGNNSFSGQSQALCVVDGTPTSNIEWISPCQVRTIDILKGSDAAIYGTRGGNGVVMITLRK